MAAPTPSNPAQITNDWPSFLKEAGLKLEDSGDAVVFEAFKKARTTPIQLAAATPENLKSTLDAYVPYGEIRTIIEDALKKLSAPPPSSLGSGASPNIEIIHFVEELHKSTIENDVLELKNGACFFGWEPWGSKLYLRKAYKSITERIFKEDLKRTLIIGNPGIGKTFYLFYLLKILLDQKATVVYQRHAFEHWYLFTPNGQVACGPKTDLPSVLKDPNTWYLVDTDSPLQHHARIVMVSSPCKDHYKEFMKLDVCVIYMPIFSLFEIHDCRKITRPLMPKEEVNKLYSRWGGIPRYVLELTERKHKAQQHSLDKAIKTADLQRIIRYIGDEDAPDDASHKIVHMISSEEEGYSQVHMQLASPYVAQAVVELFVKQKRDDLIIFLSTSDVDNEKVAVLRGNLFEGFAHQQIQAGGRFQIRSLETQNERWLDVEPKHWCFFHKSADIIGIQPSHYLKPYSKRFCAIDALMAKPACFLQITMASSHAVSASMLRELIAVYRKVFPTGKIPLIFVVPESIFPTFRRQTYKRHDKTSSEEDGTEQVDMVDLHAEIEQYVLALPLLLEHKEHTTELPRLEVRQLPAATCDDNKCGHISARGNVCPNNKTSCAYHSPAAMFKKAEKRKKN